MPFFLPFHHYMDTTIHKITGPYFIPPVNSPAQHGHYILVRHFNYTSWPEHGVPESCSTFIKFVKAVRAHRHENTTIAVHCRYPRAEIWPLKTDFIQLYQGEGQIMCTWSRAAHTRTSPLSLSAGVGRTGVFIALDHLIQHVRDHDFVDIYGLVAELRSERMCTVQNLVSWHPIP